MLSTKVPRVYLVGPMTGFPESNYPAFNAVTARLRAMGYRVENPAEKTLPAEAPWGQCMRAAIRKIVSSDVVATLPGWDKSQKAQPKIHLAERLETKATKASRLTENRKARPRSLSTSGPRSAQISLIRQALLVPFELHL